MDEYVVYCDGSYQDSIKAGGWSSVILKDGKVVKKLYQGCLYTTNNRCEIRAVLETLRYFKERTRLEIHSDSQYVINSIVNGHAKQWFDNQDFSKKNLDLWFDLLEELEKHDVTFVWVKGHNGDEYNELADMLAVHAAQCLNLKEDEVGTLSV